MQYELHKIISIEKEGLLNKIVTVEDDIFLSGEECHRVKMNKSHNIAFLYIPYHYPLTHLFILSIEYSACYPRSSSAKRAKPFVAMHHQACAFCILANCMCNA